LKLTANWRVEYERFSGFSIELDSGFVSKISGRMYVCEEYLLIRLLMGQIITSGS